MIDEDAPTPTLDDIFDYDRRKICGSCGKRLEHNKGIEIGFFTYCKGCGDTLKANMFKVKDE